MDCVFCKIINGEIPAFKVYEDDVVLAFLDQSPDSNGHTLIIPKKHFLDIDEIDLETLMHIMDSSKKIKKLLEAKLHIDGLTLIQNNGAVQEVKHFHLHLKPYYKIKQELVDIKEIYDKLRS
ncbi:MAG: HIT domain-containing protein [Bacilli bacterium]